MSVRLIVPSPDEVEGLETRERGPVGPGEACSVGT
jgi:hypothetical protein